MVRTHPLTTTGSSPVGSRAFTALTRFKTTGDDEEDEGVVEEVAVAENNRVVVVDVVLGSDPLRV